MADDTSRDRIYSLKAPVPRDWYVDPIQLGVPGSEPVDEDDARDGWRADARCAQIDPELMFPESREDNDRAKAVCSSCTVTEQCLTWALAHDERFGVWGGLTAAERLELKTKRKRHPRAGETFVPPHRLPDLVGDDFFDAPIAELARRYDVDEASITALRERVMADMPGAPTW